MRIVYCRALGGEQVKMEVGDTLHMSKQNNSARDRKFREKTPILKPLILDECIQLQSVRGVIMNGRGDFISRPSLRVVVHG